ncbi:MAG: hypothetical protein WCP85_00200 [Mariniphaga sp.]
MSTIFGIFDLDRKKIKEGNLRLLDLTVKEEHFVSLTGFNLNCDVLVERVKKYIAR